MSFSCYRKNINVFNTFYRKLKFYQIKKKLGFNLCDVEQFGQLTQLIFVCWIPTREASALVMDRPAGYLFVSSKLLNNKETKEHKMRLQHWGKLSYPQ